METPETPLNKLFSERTKLRQQLENEYNEETVRELKLVQDKIDDILYDWDSDSFGF